VRETVLDLIGENKPLFYKLFTIWRNFTSS